MIEKLKGLNFLQQRRTRLEELKRKEIENYWTYKYGIDRSLIAESLRERHGFFNHDYHMKMAEEFDFVPLSFRDLTTDKKFSQNIYTAVLFDTTTSIEPGNHFLYLYENEGLVFLRFCDNFGRYCMRYKDGNYVDIAITVDEPFFTGFTLVNYFNKETGQFAEILNAHKLGIDNFRSKSDYFDIYLSKSGGIISARDRKSS